MDSLEKEAKKQANKELSKQLNSKKNKKKLFKCCQSALCQVVDSIQEPETEAAEEGEVPDEEPEAEAAEEEEPEEEAGEATEE